MHTYRTVVRSCINMFLSRLLLAYFAIENVVARRMSFRRNVRVSEEDVLLKFNVATRTFEQKLDHFNPVEERTWKQRYFVSEEFFNGRKEGPVFLNIGGEAPAEAYMMDFGDPWMNYAKKYKALCFMIEHRYYGKSQPTRDMSTKNLQYLTSQQALADLATFIVGMNQKYNLSPDVKWVVFGGSYAGALAAWMRAKYPHLVLGAVASSATLLAKLDYKEYFEVVESALRTYSEDCVSAVKESFGEMDTLLCSKKGRQQIVKQLKACHVNEDVLTHKKKIWLLYITLANCIGLAVQGNDVTNDGINHVCDIMTNQTLGTPMERLAVLNCGSHSFNLDYEDNISEPETPTGVDPWVYQTCTEFGYFLTSSQPDHFIGKHIPVDLYIDRCQDLFSPDFNKTFVEAAILRTNTLYGALDIQVTNVVFVHGSLDPWHPLGLTKTKNPAAPVIFINGTSHCANMYAPTASDPPQLKAAREEIQRLIGVWLAK